MSTIFDQPITVPEDDLFPSWEPLPPGSYIAQFTRAEAVDNGKGWEAVSLQHTEFLTTDRESTLQNGAQPINLAGREINFRITTGNSNPSSGAQKSVEIGQQQALQAAVALGIAVHDGNGYSLPPVSSTQELADLFNTVAGTEVRVRVGQEKSQDGSRTFNNIKGVRPLSED